MAVFSRAFDWAATPLGPVHAWPQSLRTALAIMTTSRFPMMIHWGPQLLHFYNDGYAQIMQAKHPGALGAPARDWWPEIWDLIGPIFDAVWRGETTYFEDSLVLPNRRGHVEECYFTFCHSPIRDESGAVGGIFVTAVETTAHVVSERRLTTLREIALRTSAARAAVPGDGQSSCEAVADALASNPNDAPFAALYLRDGQGARYAAGARVTAADVDPVLAAAVERVLASGTAETLRLAEGPGAFPGTPWREPAREVRLIPLAPDGDPPAGVLAAGISPRRPLDDGYLQFLDTVADHAAQAVDAERAFASEHARLRAVMLRAPTPMALVVGPEHRYALINDAARRLVGGGRDVVGQTLREAHPGPRGRLLHARFNRVFRTGRPWTATEMAVRFTATGQEQDAWFDVHLEPLRSPGGGVEAILSVAVDLTGQILARRNAERLLAVAERAQGDAEAARKEAEDANRAKSEFLAVMSHELRTPLNAIGGYAELLEMGIRGPVTAEQRTDLGRIQSSQRHLLGLINEVLNYAKLESGTVEFDIVPVGVRDVLASVVELVLPQADKQGLKVNVQDVPAGLLLLADPEKLRQVLANLLSNAVKFTEPGGSVALGWAASAENVWLSVEDTGIGIPPGKLRSVFEPFVQVRSDLTRVQEGTGLGLAISRDLARHMGGDLTVESTPGIGSRFTLRLPRAREA